MMIILNGSRNAGKTTIARLLSERLPKTANLEVDRLREFIYCFDLEESIALNLENAVSVAQNLVRAGLHVVLNYPLRNKDYEYLVENLKPLDTEIHTFTLRPTLDAALSNRGTRKPTPDDHERIRKQYDKKSPHQIPDLGTVIDNTAKTPEEVAEYILQSLG